MSNGTLDTDLDAFNDTNGTDLVRITVTVFPVLRVSALTDDTEIEKIAGLVEEKARAEFMRQIGEARRLQGKIAAAAAAEMMETGTRTRESGA